MKSNNKLFLKLLIIILVLVSIGLIIYLTRHSQNYQTKDATKLSKFFEKKGWLKNPQLRSESLLSVKNLKGGEFKDQCPEGECPGLGKGFYLSKINLTNPGELLSGSDIFLKVTQENDCVKTRKGGKILKTIVTTDNTEELISAVSSENNIKGSLPLKVISVKPTLSYNTKYDINKHDNIKTSRFIIMDEVDIVNLQNNNTCRRSNTNPEFISDFRRLPIKISKPEINSEWQPFYKFLNKWGSHVMTQITFGSRLEHWESCLDSGNISNKELEAKACLEISGPISEITADICSNYTKDEKEKALKLETNKITIIIGGTREIREKIALSGITDENVKDFLNSSSESDEAIGYNFTPIWEIYQQVSTVENCLTDVDDGNPLSDECKDLQRCLNLEAAYAYQTVDCELLKTPNGVIYQSFQAVRDIPAINTYKCVASKEGCTHTETDCHMTKGGCKAFGPSAFEKGNNYFGNLYKTKIRGLPKESSFDGINNSCKFSGIQCKCDKMWSGGLDERILWDQGDRD